MKEPHQVLMEIALGKVKCFSEHTDSMDEFESCVRAVKAELFGISTCCLILLKKCLEGKKVRKFTPLDDTIRFPIDPLLLRHSIIIHDRLHALKKNLLCLRNLIWYENKEEIRKFLVPKFFKGLRVPKIFSKRAKELYQMRRKRLNFRPLRHTTG